MNDLAPAFVDTNVLVYAFDRGDQRSHAAAALIEELAESGRLLLSTQVVQEFLVTITRKIPVPLTWPEALAVVDDLAVCGTVAVNDLRSIREAGRLSDDAGLSFWEALIIVAAAHGQARVLYSEDLNAGQTILGVTMVNPFALDERANDG
jgi:predicted nucleic acid-binding protein